MVLLSLITLKNHFRFQMATYFVCECIQTDIQRLIRSALPLQQTNECHHFPPHQTAAGVGRPSRRPWKLTSSQSGVFPFACLLECGAAVRLWYKACLLAVLLPLCVLPCLFHRVVLCDYSCTFFLGGFWLGCDFFCVFLSGPDELLNQVSVGQSQVSHSSASVQPGRHHQQGSLTR